MAVPTPLPRNRGRIARIESHTFPAEGIVLHQVKVPGQLSIGSDVDAPHAEAALLRILRYRALATSSPISLSGTSAKVGSTAAASEHSRNAACSAGVCAASTALTAIRPSDQASGNMTLLHPWASPCSQRSPPGHPRSAMVSTGARIVVQSGHLVIIQPGIAQFVVGNTCLGELLRVRMRTPSGVTGRRPPR